MEHCLKNEEEQNRRSAKCGPQDHPGVLWKGRQSAKWRLQETLTHWKDWADASTKLLSSGENAEETDDLLSTSENAPAKRNEPPSEKPEPQASDQYRTSRINVHLPTSEHSPARHPARHNLKKHRLKRQSLKHQSSVGRSKTTRWNS